MVADTWLHDDSTFRERHAVLIVAVAGVLLAAITVHAAYAALTLAIVQGLQ